MLQYRSSLCMGFLNTIVFIIEKSSFSSKSSFEFLKKKFASLSKLDSGNWILKNSSFKIWFWILEIVYDRDSSVESRLSTYLWPVLYVELLILKYWRCSCCFYVVISLNFMWNNAFLHYKNGLSSSNNVELSYYAIKKVVENCKFCHLNVQSQEATYYLEELPSLSCRGN